MDVFYVTSSFYANYVFSGNKKITAPDVLNLPVKAHAPMMVRRLLQAYYEIRDKILGIGGPIGGPIGGQLCVISN